MTDVLDKLLFEGFKFMPHPNIPERDVILSERSESKDLRIYGDICSKIAA